MDLQRRRLVGTRTATLIGVSAVTLVIAGCADGVADGVEVCARDQPPYTRADDIYCDRGEPGFGRYVMQLPDTQYDYDDDTYIYSPIIVPNVGQPLPPGATGPRSGFVRSTPDLKNPGRVAGVGRVQRVPTGPTGAKAAGTTISRGGLGISGYSSSSGS